MKIENRTFIISGGSSGLGLATVRNLLEARAYVAILDKQVPPMTELSEVPSPRSTITSSSIGSSSLLSRDLRLKYFEVNLLDLDRISTVIEEVASWTKETGATMGGIIHCAGIGELEQLINGQGTLHSEKIWDMTLSVNVSGTFHLTRMALQHFIKVPREEPDGERGVIVMVSSSVAYDGTAGQIAYAASKGAIRSMTLPMARDLARHGIRVVTIAPGPFTSPLTDVWPERITKSVHRDMLLYPKRFGFPTEFADTVRWILNTPYVNGESIKLTAGIRAKI
ncbi:NAD(P)-binding protein [Dendrothele bispora CBS 962.96]|uniref:NAD(P)-binding protein n=1 Tax=Dendrothele bispora (strain CBS 962.96) TaxID=1314807 RepID=A0A4S8KYW0_DENBC|nr:NAD(P)-binding protein [Dendrothele bispora CBS 962.96]